MNESTRAALDRIVRSMNRRKPKRPRGFSAAPLVVAAGIVLGYQLLVRLVPQVWANILPGGFEQGAFLGGWPGIVWKAAWYCRLHFATVAVGGFVIVAAMFLVGRRPITRPIAWLAAVVVILLNAGILYVTMKTGMDAAGVGQVLG